MLRSLVPALLIFTSLSFASTQEDVIYKKDGSILRGTLIEQNFETGTYKIEIHGGSVFVIQQSDISKITKEAPFEQNNTPSQVNASMQPPLVSTTQTASVDTNDDITNGVFFIGRVTRNLTVESSNSSEYEYLFSGWNLGSQTNFHQNLALYADLNVANFQHEIQDYGWASDQSDLPYTRYASAQVSLLISTNQYKGWQFFTGFGRFKERFDSEERTKTYEGEVYHFGLGYSWKSLQLILRLNVLDGDHPEHFVNNTNGHLQLGFNFQ